MGCPRSGGGGWGGWVAGGGGSGKGCHAPRKVCGMVCVFVSVQLCWFVDLAFCHLPETNKPGRMGLALMRL